MAGGAVFSESEQSKNGASEMVPLYAARVQGLNLESECRPSHIPLAVTASRSPVMQKAPQCRHNPDSFGWRVAGATAWLLVAGVDDRGDEMKELEVHCRCPCLVSQTWAAAAQNRRSSQLNRQ